MEAEFRMQPFLLLFQKEGVLRPTPPPEETVELQYKHS